MLGMFLANSFSLPLGQRLCALPIRKTSAGVPWLPRNSTTIARLS
jgi:hypothetical protein